MFSFIRRLFGWFTLISLLVWGGIAAWIVMSQYKDVPPVGWPADYATCVSRWSVPESSAAKAQQILGRCGDYYALLGDRTAPVLKRLQQQVQGRLTEAVINAYLAEDRPGPDEAVSGKDILAKLGTARVAGMFYQSLRQMDQPPSVLRRAQLRCMLEETRRAQYVVDPAYITQNCMRR